MVSNIILFFRKHFNPAMESLLDSNPPPTYRPLTVVWLAGLYLFGLLVFGYFLNFGSFDMVYQDWAEVTGPRLQFLQSAIQNGQLPFTISDSSTFHLETNRYLAVGDVFASPQYLLLGVLSLPAFCVVNLWLLYSLGFLGLIFIFRKLHLSALSFTFLFLLFNFNGGILAHYYVGHTTFGGYFLFTWFALLVFRLLEGDHSWKWSTLTALLLLAIWLQGSFHQFVWLIILLCGIAIFVPKTFWTVLRTGIVIAFVCAFRLLPCIIESSSLKFAFLNGYPSIYSIWVNLVNLPDPNSSPFFFNGVLGTSLGEWELTQFIGLVGTIFMLFFGVALGLFHRKAPYRNLLGPVGLLFLLSLGLVYKWFSNIPIPLFQGERVSSRIFSVVLVFGLILASERFQRWIENSPDKPISLLSGLIGLGAVSFDLGQNYFIWRVAFHDPNSIRQFDPANWYVVSNSIDITYSRLVWFGLAITFLSIMGLIWICHIEKSKAKGI
jgi:hypothetical protein